ncbi:MAG TPA: DUF1425 domain-containing protein [Deltaproteobacteria bacterium]|nr:DUF1425 domain-containing protein [Deltaproteobacteria bacterium]HOI06777.1 DUF1425 domain-containing protein [Deltaproteobacteria bacterium]
MTRRRYLVWLLALLLAGCAGTAPNVLHVQAGPGGLSSSNVEINDKWLARSLRFGEVSVRPLGLGSSMEAQVMVTNSGSGEAYFEYRFLWYDAAGFETSTVTNWIPASLGGRESRGFKSTAPGPNATSFKFMIRKEHPVTSTGS